MDRPKCKDCARYDGNCGFHHIDSNGHINYEIPCEAATDRYGQAMCFVDNRTNQQRAVEALENCFLDSELKRAIIDAIERGDIDV